MNISSSQLNELTLIPYEGAGNRTPILDISSLIDNINTDPTIIRSQLESNIPFRTWLAREGKCVRADSIMIYYLTSNEDYDAVTFIGEPGVSINAPFSDMCGNGIRSLVLHIILSSSDQKRNDFLSEGMGIWAGEVRTVLVSDINFQEKSGTFRVEMGPFTMLYAPMIIPHPLLKNMRIHSGFNGQTTGEPHVVILITDEDLASWRVKCSAIARINDPLEIARTLVCLLGKDITFNSELFPRGVNVNVGLIQGNTISMSTHERNIHSSQSTCIADQQKNTFCRCNTLACGTGGAAVANIALLLFPHMDSMITTIHPGGTIQYDLRYGYTTMIGNAHQSAI